MSRFRKLSHTLWHCQYHIYTKLDQVFENKLRIYAENWSDFFEISTVMGIVWVPKYRFRILTGKIKTEVESCVRSFVDQQKAEVVELNV